LVPGGIEKMDQTRMKVLINKEKRPGEPGRWTSR
jgi:hypothetical protein